MLLYTLYYYFNLKKNITFLLHLTFVASAIIGMLVCCFAIKKCACKTYLINIEYDTLLNYINISNN